MSFLRVENCITVDCKYLVNGVLYSILEVYIQYRTVRLLLGSLIYHTKKGKICFPLTPPTLSFIGQGLVGSSYISRRSLIERLDPSWKTFPVST